jgi:hypothetical protein
MPCYSVITETQITDVNRLVKALGALNIEVYSKSNLEVDTDIGTFSRRTKDISFNFGGYKEKMAPVGRKYAEMTVREWGIRNGMGITENDGKTIKLKSRR